MLDLIVPETTEEVDDVPSLNHSYLCAQIMRQLLQSPALLPLPELTLNVDKGLTPDISVYLAEQVHPDFFNDVTKYDQMPLLAVEVVSSSQNIQDLLGKAAKLVAAGVQAVWTLEPYSRTVFLTDKTVTNQILHNQTVETNGIKVDFKRIFEGR